MNKTDFFLPWGCNIASFGFYMELSVQFYVHETNNGLILIKEKVYFEVCSILEFSSGLYKNFTVHHIFGFSDRWLLIAE